MANRHSHPPSFDPPDSFLRKLCSILYNNPIPVIQHEALCNRAKIQIKNMQDNHLNKPVFNVVVNLCLILLQLRNNNINAGLKSIGYVTRCYDALSLEQRFLVKNYLMDMGGATQFSLNKRTEPIVEEVTKMVNLSTPGTSVLFPVHREFDVFMCANGAETAEVLALCEELEAHRIQPWHYKMDGMARPGFPTHSHILAPAIKNSKTFAVCLGAHGLAHWQKSEIGEVIQLALSEGQLDRPIIPIILRSFPIDEMPDFQFYVNQMGWVDFRTSPPDPMKALLYGITGDPDWPY